MKYGELKISGLRPLIFSKGLGVPTDEITRLCIQTTWKPTGQPPYRFAIAHETKVHTLKRCFFVFIKSHRLRSAKTAVKN